jgi:ribosome-associated protein
VIFVEEMYPIKATCPPDFSKGGSGSRKTSCSFHREIYAKLIYNSDIGTNAIVPEDELQFTFVRSSGPGGQNVNKVSTAARLRFHVPSSKVLNNYVKDRLLKIAGSRATAIGDIIIFADTFRTQERNRKEAIDRLNELIVKAEFVPKIRKKTKPGKAAKASRVDAKKRHADTKNMRKKGFYHNEM